MSLGVLLTVFVLIVPAELPDKTFVATLVLSTRYPPLPVFVGVSIGFAVQSAIAVLAGSVITLLPATAVRGVSAGIFAVGAVLLFRSAEEEDETEAAGQDDEDDPEQPHPLRIALTSFLVLVAAEWGDLSQLLTASFQAKYSDPLAVFLGAFLALSAVAGLAVTAGRALLRVVPLHWVRRIAAVGFAVVAVVTALQAAGVL